MNSDLQNRLYDFEADPPKEVWNKITDALDTEQTYPQRLYEYEQQPRSQVWDQIELALEEPQQIKVIPITKFKKPLRYVAVAASIIAAVLIINRFSNNKNEASASIGGTIPAATNQSSILPSLNQPAEPEPQSDQTEDNLASTTGKETGPQPRRAFASLRTQAVLPMLSLRGKFIPGKVDKEAIYDFSASDNYMVYTDGNGTTMKLPKKLFSLVNCQDGDESCRERLQELQQKLASNATTTDFAGILEILRQLQ